MIRTRMLFHAVALATALSFGAQLRASDHNPAPLAAEGAPLFEQVLQLNRVQEPELDLAAAKTAFLQLVDRVRQVVEKAPSPAEKIGALNRVLLADRQVSYLSNKYWRDSTLAASLLRGRGNCLSTSTLYVLVGQQLKLPLHLVLIPQHAFVRWDDGETRINIETTRGGIQVDDQAYGRMGQATPEDAEKLGWGKSLDADGFMGELLEVAANHRVEENRLEDALTLLGRAEELQPGRSDRAFARIKIESDLTGDRETARRKMAELLMRGAPPPTIATSVLMHFAEDVGADGDHARERELLLLAFERAPKSAQETVLQQLAFCLRALRDFHGAVRYMELALALGSKEGPPRANSLYNYAILLKNDQRLDDALTAIRAALELNPESWNLQMLEAGFLMLKGEREQGQALYAKIEPPRGDVEFFAAMQAWFHAVSGEREKFYTLFRKALEGAKSNHILHWIDQDVDLDPYRNEAEFKTLLDTHRRRLTGKPVVAKPQPAAPATKGEPAPKP